MLKWGVLLLAAIGAIEPVTALWLIALFLIVDIQ